MKILFAALAAPTLLVACASTNPQTNPETTTMNTTTANHATPSTLPAAAAVVTHEVADYAAWRKAFDDGAAARKRAGIVGTHVNRGADDGNLVSVYLAANDLGALKTFLGSDDLKTTMANAGVKSQPTVALITPVEDMTVRDRPLPGAIISHRVASYETWKSAFDGDASARASAGIIGHAINRSIDDPNVVIVYLQSTKLDEVKAFTASPDLKATMMKAGVQGAPRIAFVQGQDWGS
jgi:hypothetical protein